jgi:hypothetical protein
MTVFDISKEVRRFHMLSPCFPDLVLLQGIEPWAIGMEDKQLFI